MIGKWIEYKLNKSALKVSLNCKSWTWTCNFLGTTFFLLDRKETYSEHVQNSNEKELISLEII